VLQISTTVQYQYTNISPTKKEIKDGGGGRGVCMWEWENRRWVLQKFDTFERANAFSQPGLPAE